MSEESTVPVGQESTVPAEQTQSPAGSGKDQEDKYVSRDSYLKVLNERKRDAERRREAEEELSKYRDKERQELESKAHEKGEFDKVLGTYKEQVGMLSSKVESFEKRDIDRKKIGAFLGKIPGELVKDDYLAFVDLESIGYDPDTGEIDPLSVEHEAKKFMETHPTLIKSNNGLRLPGHQKVGEQRASKVSIKNLTDAQLKEMILAGKFKE